MILHWRLNVLGGLIKLRSMITVSDTTLEAECFGGTYKGKVYDNSKYTQSILYIMYKTSCDILMLNLFC